MVYHANTHEHMTDVVSYDMRSSCLFFLLISFSELILWQGPLVSADVVGIAMELDKSIQAISRALGSALVLALALATVVWSALSVKLGKRGPFLASTLLMLAGSIIASYSRLYILTSVSILIAFS
jgi:MFS family permease